MARDLVQSDVLYGELMSPSLPKTTSLRNNIATRVNIRTAVLVANAQAEIIELDIQLQMSRANLREYENQVEKRINLLNLEHRRRSLSIEIDIARLEKELAAERAK
jgi:hypothetical protein